MKKNYICIFLLISIFLTNCKVDQNPCSLPESILRDIHEFDSIINVPGFKEGMAAWNKEQYDESAIFNSSNETYRFRISPSFENTEIFRIEKKEDSYNAVIKEFDAYSSRLIYFEEKEISEKTWNSITNKLKNNDFWIYPNLIDKGIYLDGTAWEIEGFKPVKDQCTFKNYHGISRLNLQDSTFKSMCNSFLILKENHSIDQ